MSIDVTFRAFAAAFAARTIEWQQPPVSDDRRRQILPATTRNRMVEIFNGSTVLLGVSVISIFLISTAVAVVFASIALFVRYVVQRELFPRVENLKITKAALVGLNPTFDDKSILDDVNDNDQITIAGTFQVGGAEPKALLKIFGFVLWMDKEPLPPVRPERRGSAGVGGALRAAIGLG